MKKKELGIAAIAAGGLAAMLLSLGGPVQASATALAGPATIATGIEHHHWIEDFQPTVTVPKVDTTVRHSGR